MNVVRATDMFPEHLKTKIKIISLGNLTKWKAPLNRIRYFLLIIDSNNLTLSIRKVITLHG